jgi:acyl-CoA synthetase (AMP-forming)/AMP-acid ligase II/acyl carrier protein
MAAVSADNTFVDVLRSWAAQTPDAAALTFLEDGEDPTQTLTYRSLDRRAREIATRIRKTASEGERAVLLYRPGLEFVTAFLGCLYAGVVPVPAYPPRNQRHMTRIQAILADADARCVLTETALEDRLAAWMNDRGDSLSLTSTDSLTGDGAAQWKPATNNTLNSLAFLQYTSGSTGIPKGVMVTHRNLMANERMIQLAMRHSERLVAVSWLPIYHDMGLIGNLMQPLFLGGHCVLMSPGAFLQKPRRWLAAITEYRAQVSGAPNFAFRLCTKSVRDDQKSGLDLSTLNVLFCGSEPINASVLDEFESAFRGIGLRREALYCCYGMAETTLMAAGSTFGAGPIYEEVDGDALAQNEATPPRQHSTSRRVIVGSGKSVQGQELAIVHPEHRHIMEDGQVGEIWVRGPNVAAGYWGKPELTRQTFQARLRDADGHHEPFLRTGDLGFLHETELFVTGRIKDLIIIRGRNHYPQDIEVTVQQSHTALRTDCGAALSTEVDGEERLVVVQELDRHRHEDAEQAVAAIRIAITEEHEIAPYAILLVRQNGVPKTSSGKIQRSACIRAFLERSLPAVYEWHDTPKESPSATDAGQSRSRDDIEDFLIQKLSGAMGISPGAVDVHQQFSSFGVDSLALLELLEEFEDWLGHSLSETLFWDYPTISHVADYLSKEIAASDADDSP